MHKITHHLTMPDLIISRKEMKLTCPAQRQQMCSSWPPSSWLLSTKNLATEATTIISEQESLLAANTDNYVIKLEMIPIVRVTLKIKKASAADDGEYTCRTQKTGTSDALESATKQVVFVAPVSEVKLTVNDEVKAEGDTIESKPGTLTVNCEAMGSNPEPLIQVMVGDQMIETGTVNSIMDKEGNTERRSFKSAVTFELDFDHSMFEKALKCQAKPTLPDDVTPPSPAEMAVSVNLKGIVDKPVISCHNNTAGLNDRRVTLTCFVSKVPKVKSVMFNVGNRHQLYPGNQTESLTEVIQKGYNDTHDEVILKFYEMKEWHFSANIYLDVKTFDNQVFQYPVYLLKGDTPSEKDVNGATSLSGAITLLAVCLLAGLLQKVL
ncbi:uncharacterized protein LOC124264945 isoform X2 [Haliotis rubra]|uniref:uncharacterized protein LOC124264945 isoform X2 n=1 Tax=Haliotis rubra TaxID=36100 RepID=UPI001EE4FABE|nr:uncharacterized protein LOC124264945 isoform X2 [Haliotis rubra]